MNKRNTLFTHFTPTLTKFPHAQNATISHKDVTQRYRILFILIVHSNLKRGNMDIQTAVKERLSHIETERQKLMDLLSTYSVNGNGDVNKSERYRNFIRRLMHVEKAYHITDIEQELNRSGMNFNKPLVHQCLSTLRESGEIIAIRVNGSNQKYFYLNADAKKGEGVKDDYLPMPKEYIESVEVM